MPTEKNAFELKNPLLLKDIRPIRNWHEWLQLFNTANTFQELEGLLHVGFTVQLERRGVNEQEYDDISRNEFYFKVSDSWTDYIKLWRRTEKGEDHYYSVGKDRNGNTIWENPGQLRKRVARKAFDMLCLNFFNTELKDRDGDHPPFWKDVTSERLFPIIQDFFRIEKNYTVRNLSLLDSWRSHNEVQAVNFLIKLAQFMWGWREDYFRGRFITRLTPEQAAMGTRIDDAKPWMIEILSQLDQLEMLRKYILKIEEPCLDKLRQIALRTELKDHRHPVAKDRSVVTLEEACYAGSKAALFLKEHEIKRAEDVRLRAIREAEYKQEEAQREIEKLSNK